ncbi:MAG: hypothetical protein AAGF46_04715, partial [Pseudomonadota bacterium]
MNTRHCTTALLLAVVLAGCSDSNRPSTTPVATPPVSSVMTGSFAGLEPEGLAYQTETRQGMTGAGGTFEYEAGETVSFALGGTDLGSATAAAEVTVFHLAGLSGTPVGEREISKVSRTGDNTGGFNGALRLARVLLAFDTDGDTTNGVQIAAATEARLATIDFNPLGVSSEYLSSDVTRAVRASVLAGEMPARVIPTLGEAMATVYNSLGRPSGLYLPGRTEYDNDADGVVDQIELYVFDATGMPLEYAYDDDADGNANYRDRYQYATAGRPLVQESDDNGDGIYDRTVTSTYDAFGTVTESARDSDGQPGFEYTATRQYDDAGVQIFAEQVNTAAGTRVVQRWTTDSAGNRTEYLLDQDGDGTVDRRDTFSYNAFRSWTERAIDSNNDGVVNDVNERTFNALNQQTLATTDNGADGTIERRTEFRYSTNNQLAEIIYDNDADPEVDFAVRFTFNADGQEVERVTDQSFSNRPNLTGRNEYDADGNRVRRTVDSNGDGMPNFIGEYEFDANGWPTLERRDNNG